MSKYDIYLLENSRVLKNKLGIENEAALDKAESIMANTKMALLYNSSFLDFSPSGVCKIHKTIFGDVYEWAGEYRIINVQKREAILAGKSVWYSNWEDIDRDLKAAWQKIDTVDWAHLSHDRFCTIRCAIIPCHMADTSVQRGQHTNRSHADCAVCRTIWILLRL